MAKSNFIIRKPGTMRLKRPMSHDKARNTEKAYLKLLRRQKKEGETVWMRKTIARTIARLEKYGIKPENLATTDKK